MNLKKIILLLLFACSIAIIASSTSINNSNQNSPNYKEGIKDLSGEALAKIYCATCHLFPSPSLLDQETWTNNVLPNMGWRLGIRNKQENPYEEISTDEKERMLALNIYPNKQIIKRADWDRIVAYYKKNAPAKPILSSSNSNYVRSLSLFKAEPVFIGDKKSPRTCLLKFDTTVQSLYIGDAGNELYVMQPNMQLSGYWQTTSPPVDVNFINNEMPQLLCIGSFVPSEEKSGKLFTLDTVARTIPIGVNLERLARPVQFANEDINGDGVNDLVVCQFGNHTGKLSWFESGNPLKEHILKKQQGARKAIVYDFNEDGLKDILVLFAQSKEGISLFQNKGNGVFSENIVQQFSPVFGSSNIELFDFNKDGFMDILMTNGDNWDLSPIRKNYHGVRIFTNDGKNHFNQTYFFPIYGASKAIASDFDQDGDVDIAAISFYDNPEHPEDGFVYLENKGNMNFQPLVSTETGNGKWLTMEVCDFDKDGDQDIILGSYFHKALDVTSIVMKSGTSLPQILILKNTTK